MRVLPFAGALALIIASGASAPTGIEGELKCGSGTPTRFPNAPEPVYVVDGQAIPEQELSALDRGSIESLEVLCFEEIHRRFGIEARRSGIVIFTKPGPEAVLTATLDSLASKQSAYLATRGRFARTLDDLDWREPSELISIDLVVSDDGNRWSAVGTHRWLRAESTRSVSGSRTPPGGG